MLITVYRQALHHLGNSHASERPAQVAFGYMQGQVCAYNQDSPTLMSKFQHTGT